jgi:hypothetical protein
MKGAFVPENSPVSGDQRSAATRHDDDSKPDLVKTSITRGAGFQPDRIPRRSSNRSGYIQVE